MSALLIVKIIVLVVLLFFYLLATVLLFSGGWKEHNGSTDQYRYTEPLTLILLAVPPAFCTLFGFTDRSPSILLSAPMFVISIGNFFYATYWTVWSWVKIDKEEGSTPKSLEIFSAGFFFMMLAQLGFMILSGIYAARDARSERDQYQPLEK